MAMFTFAALIHAVFDMVLKRTPTEQEAKVERQAKLFADADEVDGRIVALQHDTVVVEAPVPEAIREIEFTASGRMLRCEVESSQMIAEPASRSRIKLRFKTEDDRLQYLQELYVAHPKEVFDQLERSA
jgi:hypothetical protein